MNNAERRHTPGPWEVDKEGRLFHRPKPLVKYIIADLQSSNELNESLLKAAPDLLDAASATRKLVAEAAMTGFNHADGDWAERIFLNQANLSAAIKKAEGRA